MRHSTAQTLQLTTPMITELSSKNTHVSVAVAGKVHLIRSYVMTPRWRHVAGAVVRLLVLGCLWFAPSTSEDSNQNSRILGSRDSGAMLASALSGSPDGARSNGGEEVANG